MCVGYPLATILALLSCLSFLTIDVKTGKKGERERGREREGRKEGERGGQKGEFVHYIHPFGTVFFKVSEWGVGGVSQ